MSQQLAIIENPETLDKLDMVYGVAHDVTGKYIYYKNNVNIIIISK